MINSTSNHDRLANVSGHEAAFVVLLSCLFRLGVFVDSDRPAIVTRIFARLYYRKYFSDVSVFCFLNSSYVEVPAADPSPATHLLDGACRQSGRVVARRLPVHPVHLGQCAAHWLAVIFSTADAQFQ